VISWFSYVAANVGGREFADSLAGDVQRILVSSTVRPIVRKKAALCLLRWGAARRIKLTHNP
jgi:hypothetical protein